MNVLTRVMLKLSRKPPSLKISRPLWERLCLELRRRGGGHRESGAFLLGNTSTISDFICYDDLDPTALDSGVVVIQGAAFVLLWDFCARHKVKVIADVHTHPTDWTRQSYSDRTNPVIAQPGHLAIILPRYAQASRPSLAGAGILEYLGDHQWRDWPANSGRIKITKS